MLLGRLFFGALLLIISSNASADTYPAVTSTGYHVNGYPVVSTGQAACTAYISPSYYLFYTNNSTWYCWSQNTTAYPSTNYTTPIITTVLSCPNGGTISGSSCINAPACVSPNIRSSNSPYQCFTPVECAYPETDNGSGVCTNTSCPAGQVRNPSTKLCQTPPSCIAATTYDPITNQCDLNCPKNTHASTGNDACLPNPALGCPIGQHDDGTYQCVADDISACNANQYSGTINGVAQCITKPNLDTAQQAAADAAAALKTASTAAKTAADSYLAAEQASSADPTNAAKLQTMNDAKAALDDANAAQNVASSNNTAAQGNANNGLLSSIDRSLKDVTDSGKNTAAVTSTAAVSGVNGVFDGIGTAMGTGAADGVGVANSSFMAISNNGCQSIPMNYKGLQYTFDPCGKLAQFRAMFAWFAYMFTAYSIVKLVTSRTE